MENEIQEVWGVAQVILYLAHYWLIDTTNQTTLLSILGADRVSDRGITLQPPAV